MLEREFRVHLRRLGDRREEVLSALAALPASGAFGMAAGLLRRAWDVEKIGAQAGATSA